MTQEISEYQLQRLVSDPENTKSQWDKAISFHRRGLVVRTGTTRPPEGMREHFLVKKIPGYNKTDYVVYATNGVVDQCDCFFWRRHGKKCSHMMSVEIFLRGEANGNR